MARASHSRNANTSTRNRRNLAVIVVAVIVFSVIGFVLPTIVMFGVMSIPAAVDPSAARVGLPKVPVALSLSTGALMGAGAGIGLLLRAAESSPKERGRR